jgi:hypothetical protein
VNNVLAQDSETTPNGRQQAILGGNTLPVNPIRQHSVASVATLKILCALIGLTLPAFSASGWNSLGHRTVAELAWRQMDRAERRGASDLLRQHPHYKELLIAEVPAGVNTNEWAFLTDALKETW